MDYKGETSYNFNQGSFTIESLTQFSFHKQHCPINMYIILENPFTISNSNHWNPSYIWTYQCHYEVSTHRQALFLMSTNYQT